MVKLVYIRVSTEEQNAQTQLRDIKSMIGDEQYTIYDDAQSAWSDVKKRDGFEALKLRIKNQEVSDIYVWDFDRIYRNRARFKEFLAFLKAYRVKLHSYRQKWLEALHKVPPPWNEIVHDLMIDIYGHIAEEESEKKSDRVKKAVVREDGVTKSYKGNKWGRKALPQSAIEEIKSKHKRGLSMRQIAQSTFYYDKNRNKKKVSLGAVHKTIAQFSEGSGS